MKLEKLPPAYQEALDRLRAALTKSLGENLHSLILYGSAVRGDLEPGSSDLNLLIVLKAVTPQAHQAVRGCLDGKVRIEPFVVGLPGFERTLRVFALKFLSIKRNYRVIEGEDVLATFQVSHELFRFLAEQELRNLRLRTVQAFVSSGKRPEAFGIYLRRNATRFVVVLCDAVRTAGLDPKGPLADRVPVLQEAIGADATVLAELLKTKGTGKLAAGALDDLYARLLAVLNAAVLWMEAKPLAEPA